MRRRMSLVAGVAFALVGTTVACVPGVPGGPGAGDPGDSPAYLATLDRYASQPLEWSECFPDADLPEFECADLAAPIDWRRPDRGELSLAISRIASPAPARRRGIMMTNPGGPGGPGLLWPYYLSLFQPDLSDTYDLVGLDVRGVGRSTNLECPGTETLEDLFGRDGRDTSPANIAAQIRLSARWARQCNSDPLTQHIDTGQTVRDMDLVRAVLGEERISYLGYSAGTWLGAWFATWFPSRVDRFVFDGTTEYTTTWDESFQSQPMGFQRTYEQWFVPWGAEYDEVYGLGATAGDVTATIEALRAQLTASPLELADGSLLDGVGLDGGISSGMYAKAAYPDLAAALDVLTRYGSATPDEQDLVAENFGAIPYGPEDNTFLSVICNDTRNPSPAKVFREWLDARRFPLIGASWLQNSCPYFPRPDGSPVTGRGIPPVLIINSVGDPATPIEGALAAHRRTPGSRFVTIEDEPDHTMYGFGENACVEDIANGWLIDGVLPSADTTCDGIGLPDPTALAPIRAGAPVAAVSAGSPVPPLELPWLGVPRR